MPGTTSRGYPYPLGGEPSEGDDNIRDLALAIDADITASRIPYGVSCNTEHKLYAAGALTTLNLIPETVQPPGFTPIPVSGSRMTAQEDGAYAVNAVLVCDVFASESLLAIFRNGGGVGFETLQMGAPSNRFSLSAVIPCTAGDYVEVKIYLGGAITVQDSIIAMYQLTG